jgi:hypothetical protein
MVMRLFVGSYAAVRAALIYGDAGRMMDQPLEPWTRRGSHRSIADSAPRRSGTLVATRVKRHGGEFPGRLSKRLGV